MKVFATVSLACRRLLGALFPIGVQQLHEAAKVMSIVVEGAPANQIAIHHTGLVNVDAATDFQVKLALGHSGHSASPHAVGSRWNLNPMADAGHRQVLLEEVTRCLEQMFIFADVLRCPSTTEENARIFLWLDVFERYVCINGVAFPLLGNGPARLHFVHHHLVLALLGGGDHWLVTAFNQPVKRVKRVDGFRGVADDDEDFGLLGHGKSEG